MPFPGTGKIWMNGSLVELGRREDPHRVPRHPLRQRRVRGRPLLRHAEGLRLLPARRPHAAAAQLGEDLPDGSRSSPRPSSQAVLETIRANEMKACYIRPLVYRGYAALGVNPLRLPRRCGHHAAGNGARTSAPTRSRRAWTSASARGRAWRPNTFPSLAKSSANYANAQLIKMEAMVDGYAEGIALDTLRATSARAAAQNLFIVRNGVLYTPPLQLVDPPGHHAGLGHHARARPRLRGPRGDAAARDALHRRRAVLRAARPSRSRRSARSTRS